MNSAIQRLVNKHLGHKTPDHPKSVASKRRSAPVKSIEESTSLIPIAMAEAVVEKASRLLDVDLYNTEFPAMLVKYAEEIFQHNADFRKKVKATSGRDYLWMYMQHWLPSFLMKSRRYDNNKIRRVLIQSGFSLGRDVY